MRYLGKLLFIFATFLLIASLACLAEIGNEAKLTPTESETKFLDRLMRAEFGRAPIREKPRVVCAGAVSVLGNDVPGYRSPQLSGFDGR